MDCAIIENGNGGDLVKNPKDLLLFFGFENMVYLAMFGGNVEQSTPSKRLVAQQDFAWWGNNLLMTNDASIQLNSATERALNTVPLTSSGRVQIDNFIKTDLQFMEEFVNLTVETAITATDRLEISLRLQKPDNLQSTQFVYIWDATLHELNFNVVSPGNVIPIGGRTWDTSFDWTFGPFF